MKMNPHAELNAQLQRYIAERILIKGGEAQSGEELNLWIAEFMENYNSRIITEFEGYSPEQMACIIQNLWEENCLVKFKRLDDSDFEQIPIFRQLKCLVEILKRDGKIKLTATGALPVKLLTEIYKQGVPCKYIEKNGCKIRLEAECVTVELTHILAKLTKIIKEQKGVMTLTKSGEKLIKDNQALLELMIKKFTTEFNFAYFDHFESDNTAGVGNGFSLILVSKYGNEPRSYKFYAEKYFAAFPMLVADFSSYDTPPEYLAARCYEMRTFDIYLENFGLVERKEEGSVMDRTNDIILKKSPLFDKLLQIDPA